MSGFPEFCAPRGWECQKCGAVYAPFIASCANCAPQPSVTAPTTVPYTPDRDGSGTYAPHTWPNTVLCDMSIAER